MCTLAPEDKKLAIKSSRRSRLSKSSRRSVRQRVCMCVRTSTASTVLLSMEKLSRVLLLLTAVCGLATSTDNFTLPISGSLDLAGRGIVGSVQLTVQSANATRVTLDLFNVSDNPGLRRILVSWRLQAMHVKSLDLSGTAVVPTEGQLINFVTEGQLNTLLSIRSVFINSTRQPPDQPLQFAEFADFLYRLRAQNFVLDNWTVAGFAANFSQEDNACQSKMFDTVAVRRVGIEALVGGSISATNGVDFRWNRIALVEKVTFNSGRVDLGHNRISRLQNVTFMPGAICRVVITSHPEVCLNDNAVTMATLDDLIRSEATTLRGLDLSRNPLVSQTLPPPQSPPPSRRIRIAEWLRLESVVSAADNLDDATIERRLGDLLNRFQPVEPGVDLDLSGNRLTSLAGVAGILSLQTWSSRARRLRIARSLFSHHLNLSELPAMSSGAAELQLGDLTGSQVRSISVVAPPHFLWGLGAAPIDFSLVQAAWSGRVQVTPQPSVCCRVQGAAAGGGDQLFCFINQDETAEHRDYRRHLCGTPAESPSTLLVALCLAAAALTAAAAFTVAVVCGVRWRRRRLYNLRQRRDEKSPASTDPTAAGPAEHLLRPAMPKVESA